MYRLEGSVGDEIRLAQDTTASSITIIFQDGTVVVNSEPTIEIGALPPVRFYDFTPPAVGSYLIHWNGAIPEKQWEIIDVKHSNLRWLIQKIRDKTDLLPSARTG